MSLRAWRRADIGVKENALAQVEVHLSADEVVVAEDAVSQMTQSVVRSLAPWLGWPSVSQAIALTGAEVEMARDAGGAGLVKGGVRVVIR